MPFLFLSVLQCSLHSAGKGWIYKYASASREGFFPFQGGGPPLEVLFQHHQKESGFPKGGARGVWRRSGGGTLIFLQDVWFQTFVWWLTGGSYWQEAFDFSLLSGWKSQVLIEKWKWLFMAPKIKMIKKIKMPPLWNVWPPPTDCSWHRRV